MFTLRSAGGVAFMAVNGGGRVGGAIVGVAIGNGLCGGTKGAAVQIVKGAGSVAGGKCNMRLPLLDEGRI